MDVAVKVPNQLAKWDEHLHRRMRNLRGKPIVSKVRIPVVKELISAAHGRVTHLKVEEDVTEECAVHDLNCVRIELVSHPVAAHG